MSQKKIFAINFLSLTGVETLNKILPFLILPYLTKTLGIDKFGLIVFSLAVVQYYKSIVDYGFDLYSTREIAKNVSSSKKINKIFSTTIFIKLSISIILFLIFIFMVENIVLFNEEKYLYYATYIMIFGYALLPVWLFQGLEKMKYLTYTVFISRLTYVLLLLTLVKQPSDYLLVPIIESGSIIFSGIIALFISFYKLNIKFQLPNKSEVILQLREGWNFFVLDFVPNLYNNFATFLLGVLAGNVAVGYYAIAYKVSSAAVMLVNILRNITYPYLNKNFTYFNKVKFAMLLIGALLSIGIFLLSGFIVEIFMNQENKMVQQLIQIMSVSPLLIAIMAVYGTNYLIVKGHEKIYRNIVIMSSLIGFVLAYILINLYGAYGAAITVALTRVLISGWVYIGYISNRRMN